MKQEKISKLDLNNLKKELEGLIDTSYVEKRMFGEIQKKINEIIKELNSKNDK